MDLLDKRESAVDVVMRRRAWPVLLTALVLTVLSGLLLPGSAAAEGTSSESTVYANVVTGGDGTRTPDIVSTSANNAVVAWREGLRPGNVDMGYIRYSYTTDGGANWSRPQMLAQETSAFAWHYVILYKSGSELFAFMGRTPIADTDDDDGDKNADDGINHNGLPINDTVVKRSTDEGHSWQTYPATFPSIPNMVFAGHPMEWVNPADLNDVRHVIPYWASQRENGVLTSKDMKTWTKAGSVANGNADTVKAGENQIAASQSGIPANEMVMVARSKDDHAMTATSQDGGATWSPFVPDTSLPSADTSKAYFTKDSNGQYLYIYNYPVRSANPPDPAYRDVLYYKTKRRDGSWSAPKFFADGTEPEVDSPGTTGEGWDTYAMADEYAPGKFFVVWEYDTSRIKVNRLDISDAS
ncbi:sialidase family protein [Streptomyces sp. Marseille-Q5077]|uniref:sialidase family protein n=1 Tax=Streptomyces sp. Marseille-Q5077 TaxID=3418995 RepID=UPI003CFD7B18